MAYCYSPFGGLVMNKLSIDLETYSETSINAGVYKYTEDPAFEILLFAYSIDDGPVMVADLAMGDKVPEVVLNALSNPAVTKWAFNAQFERICLSKYLNLPSNTYLNPRVPKLDMYSLLPVETINDMPFSLPETKYDEPF